MKDDLAKLQEVIIARAKLDEELGKFQRMLAVMVVDLMGTTEYFDRYGDVAGFVRIHIFTDMMVPIAEQHGGVIAKVMGDTILAHFEDPVQSVRAAARMLCSLHSYSESRKGGSALDYSGDMHARVALNFGLGLVRDKDVFGDVVNMAFRMNRIAKSDQILIGSTLEEKIRPAGTPVKKLGPREIKGKAEKLDIFELLWREIK